ncbi:hypothetical protein PPTG_02686 [Phytophthora nicotianae INRA-310]|uniref:Uncharacterized protein n=1 Tax=Phytophthora nicotianae (strain INRA-310) TaxID=761204 RepID=W2RC16_PHYN3|nr:hypothetical protein PPTG_02686 [Phytophthora nicotianae INRA-310]ETN22953.1 hypothetical protein PPTG_02686 [Phytophthora nicotianae INRA-310]
MVEQEHVAEEARQGNLALLHAAPEDSDAHERAEDATEGASDEGEDAGEAQKCLDTSSEAKKTTDDEEDASGEDEEDEEAGEEKGDDGEEEQVASDEEGEDEAEEGGVEKETTRKRRQGKKRTVSDVEEEDLVQVPAFKAQHDLWASLGQPLKEYMEATRQKNRGEREMEPYQRKFICTHGWSERDRSTGKRTSHKLSREVYAHNHRVSEDIYSRDSVYNYIRENSDHRITMDDVHNRLRVELSHDDAVVKRQLAFVNKKTD